MYKKHKPSLFSNKKTFSTNLIQQFIQVKIYQPQIIQKLKDKQLQHLYEEKQKIKNQYLFQQIEKQKKQLEKLNKKMNELSQYKRIKQGQFQKIETLISDKENQVQLVRKMKELNQHHFDNKSKGKVLQLKNELKNIKQKIYNQNNQKYKTTTQITIKTSAIKDQKQRRKLLIADKKSILKQKLQKCNYYKSVLKQKQSRINNLNQKQRHILQSIKSLKQNKSQIIIQHQKKYNQLSSWKQSTQKDFLKKLQKFNNQLLSIIQSKKMPYQQKQKMIEVFKNAYNIQQYQKQYVEAEKEEVKFSQNQLKVIQKLTENKHLSISTNVQSNEEENIRRTEQQFGQQNNEFNNKSMNMIPLVVLSSLEKKMTNKNIVGLQQKYPFIKEQSNSPLKNPCIRKISSFSQKQILNQNNPHSTLPFNKTSNRISLPSSSQLLKIPTVMQTIKVLQKQQLSIDNKIAQLCKQQNSLDDQISYLSSKCQQTDRQIQKIKAQKKKKKG